MRLYEEYFKRHSISDVSVAHHCTVGSLILRTNPSIWQSNWVLVSIRWHEHDYHPGEYKIGFYRPVHNGYLKEQLFTQFLVTKKWHEYEDFIFKWSNSLELAFPVIGVQEVVLTAWEMFVFSHDGWFAKQSQEIKNLLFKVMDKENTIHQQYQYYQDMIAILSRDHPMILRAWKYNVLARVQNYSDWWAKIINDKRK